MGVGWRGRTRETNQNFPERKRSSKTADLFAFHSMLCLQLPDDNFFGEGRENVYLESTFLKHYFHLWSQFGVLRRLIIFVQLQGSSLAEPAVKSRLEMSSSKSVKEIIDSPSLTKINLLNRNLSW